MTFIRIENVKFMLGSYKIIMNRCIKIKSFIRSFSEELEEKKEILNHFSFYEQ